MNKKIDSISGVAGFGALMVIYAHMGTEGFFALPHHFHNLGVMVFFSMSGFLLSYLYIGKKFCAEDVASYCLSRFSRIAPGYLFAILLSFVVVSFFDPAFIYQITAENLPRALLFSSNQSVFWTIGPQVQFYVLFLVLWSVASRFRETGNAFPLILLAFICLVLLMMRRSFPGTFIASNLHYFIFGAVAGTVRRYMPLNFSQPKLMNIIHIGMLCMFLGTECGIFQISHRMRHENLHTLVMGIAVPFFIFVFSFDSASARVLFSNRLLRFMGMLSFPLYLLHMPVLYWVKKFYTGDITQPVIVVATFALILAFSAVYYYTFEKYFTVTVKAFFTQHLKTIEGLFVRLGIKARNAGNGMPAPAV